MKSIYLDYAAATPLDPDVLEAMTPYLTTEYGNPSSMHQMGQSSRDAVESAREQCADTLGCSPSEITFTSGGTESDYIAIKGVLDASDRNHCITSQIEHPAVLSVCESMQGQKTISYLTVDNTGLVSRTELEQTLTNDISLVSIIYANNEIGTIQDIPALAKLAHARGAYFHTDACQAAGLLPINVHNLGVDLMTLNGSKLYGPKGVGLLYIKSGVPVQAPMPGGGQEQGLRGGTENVAGVVGLATALVLAEKRRSNEVVRLEKLQSELIKGLLAIPQTALVGHSNKRLANNVMIKFDGIEAEKLIRVLNERDIYVSAGSACSSESTDPSHVLQAIGLNDQQCFECVRFSLGRQTVHEDVTAVIDAVSQALSYLTD